MLHLQTTQMAEMMRWRIGCSRLEYFFPHYSALK